MNNPAEVASPAAPRVSTTVESAIEKLRHAVMYGQLLPGQKLIEAALCRELNISRPSLREALRSLEAERLIELVPNRGPQVSKLDANEVQEIHEVWSLLTGQTAYLFAEIAGPDELAAQEKAYANLLAALSSGVPFDLLVASDDFFRTLALHCGNRMLFDSITQVLSRIHFLRAQAILHQRLGDLYAQECGDIMTAIRNRNSGAARRAVERHIASVCASAKQMVFNDSANAA
jgi:DNA-binding GntR family transcriptional regulator